MTTGFIYALPPAAIYDVFRRYMIGGLTAGAVKPVAVELSWPSLRGAQATKIPWGVDSDQVWSQTEVC